VNGHRHVGHLLPIPANRSAQERGGISDNRDIPSQEKIDDGLRQLIVRMRQEFALGPVELLTIVFVVLFKTNAAVYDVLSRTTERAVVEDSEHMDSIRVSVVGSLVASALGEGVEPRAETATLRNAVVGFDFNSVRQPKSRGQTKRVVAITPSQLKFGFGIDTLKRFGP
jgi:hypothetical protein